MDTKLKNRLALITLILLFTFGFKGVLSGLTDSNQSLKQNYFDTYQFADRLNQFLSYLNSFELSYMTPAEMKKSLTVTADEINEHRFRYGNLEEQVRNITEQYAQRIEEAKQTTNKEQEDSLTSERDMKIEDIRKNFADDNYVRAKIIKEKEQQIDEYVDALERYRPTFENLKTEFKYYFKDTTTGKVYTNLNLTHEGEINQQISKQTMLTIRSYPSPKYGVISTSLSSFLDLPNNQLIVNLIASKEHSIEGQIAVPKASPATSLVLTNYQDHQNSQRLYLIYLLSSLTAFVLSLYWIRKKPLQDMIPWEKWQSTYDRIPLDVRATSFLVLGLITFSVLIDNNLYYLEYPYEFIRSTFWNTLIAAVFVVLTALLGKLWYRRLKDWPSLKNEWYESLTYKVFRGLKDTFLNRGLATQVIILLALVFAFGVGAAAVILEPEFIIVYGPLFLIVGLPIFILLLKRIAYFNRIVQTTSELAKGNLSPDLEVKGKSALAVLAANINALKSGVRHSRKEQAKSERLKTELITNVSHDLRTPLTSIITYSELLKAPDLSPEDHESYLQIIDRKAKRLKILIDDLFEASKMASGNVELVKERVDLVQLLQQALAERDEAINESSLHFRLSTPERPVYALVDGQKLWRAFDNLIGNTLKYSLEDTRVYISLKLTHLSNEQVEITFKNITKYELGENIDELFERFKRGDTSRHTEGSGLGLAIAKSIIDLHEGEMAIDVDGDLFKITIVLNRLLD